MPGVSASLSHHVFCRIWKIVFSLCILLIFHVHSSFSQFFHSSTNYREHNFCDQELKKMHYSYTDFQQEPNQSDSGENPIFLPLTTPDYKKIGMSYSNGRNSIYSTLRKPTTIVDDHQRPLTLTTVDDGDLGLMGSNGSHGSTFAFCHWDKVGEVIVHSVPVWTGGNVRVLIYICIHWP